MKNYILVFIMSFAMFISCKEKKDIYFNGEVIIVDCNVSPDSLRGEKVNIDGLYTGNIWAYDTLIGFESPKFPDYCMNVFNVNTGKFLYSLCKKGLGGEEFLSMMWRDQFVYEDNQWHVWIKKESGREEGVLLNLEKPGDLIKRKMDVTVETEFQFPLSMYILNDSMFLGNNQGEMLYEEGSFIPPAYHIYNVRTKERIKSYKPYNAFIPLSDEFYQKNIHLYGFGSTDRIKPDNTKLAMGMFSLDQLNIMDIATGEIKGYRNKNSPDFNYLRDDVDNVKKYCLDMCVDDKYIYALYVNEDVLDGIDGNTINVFDWDGNFIRKIVLDKTSLFLSMGLDPVNKCLYIDALSEEDEEIYRYDVSYLYK